MVKPYFERYENLDTHWYACKTCGGRSFDSDSAALAGFPELSPSRVSHDTYCPGKTFPENHVRRVTVYS